MIYGCYSLLVFNISVCMNILYTTVHEKQNHKSLKYKKRSKAGSPFILCVTC